MILDKFSGMQLRTQVASALSVLTGFLLGGTIAYHYMEGWSWASSFYFVVSTLTTVGFGDLVPTTDASRLFTAVFMLCGVAIAIASLGIIGTSFLDNREMAMKKQEEKLKSKEKVLMSLKKRMMDEK